MRQTSRDNTKRTEKSFVEHLHASLVKHGVITDKRVIECGEYYSWERYVKHRKQCGIIKQCPICKERTADFKRHEMLKTEEECLNAGGQLFLITGTIKNKKSDSLGFLQKKLSDSVSKLKNRYWWRKLQKQSFLPTKTVYETTYSEENGFHPHVHMMFYADNQNINKTEIRNALSPVWRNLTNANLDVTKMDNVNTYAGGKRYYPESLDEVLKQQKDMMKKNFAKEELEIELVKTDSIPDYEPVISVEGILRTLKEMQDNQSYYNKR